MLEILQSQPAMDWSAPGSGPISLVKTVEYQGRVVRERSLPSFALVETTFSAHANISKHSHDHAYVSFVLRGSYVEQVDSRTYACGPGSVIFHPAGEEHADRFDGLGARLLNLQLDRGWLERLADPSIKLDSPAMLQASSFRPGLHLYSSFDSMSWPDLDDLAIELMGDVGSMQRLSSPPRWFRRSLEAVDDGVHEGRAVNLRETARECGVHPVHLSRCARKFLGTHFSSYVRQRRIEKALRMLLETRAPVVDVALSCGFADHAHFSRTFRTTLGLTPSEFRERFA